MYRKPHRDLGKGNWKPETKHGRNSDEIVPGESKQVGAGFKRVDEQDVGGPSAGGQALDAKLVAQLLDPVFHVGPAVVTAPHLQHTDPRRQVGDLRLKPVAGQIKQGLAPGVGSFGDPLADEDQPPSRTVSRHFLHAAPGHFRRLPVGLIMTAQAFDILHQPCHQDELQPQRFHRVLHTGMEQTLRHGARESVATRSGSSG